MRKYLALLILISFQGFGQLVETASTAYILEENFVEDFELFTDNNDILLVNIQEGVYNTREKNLVLVSFDGNLRYQWEIKIPVKSYKKEVGYKYKNGYFYYLLSEPHSKKLELFAVDTQNKAWSSHEIEMLTGLMSIDFEIFNGLFLVKGEYNYKPVIELHNLTNNTATILSEIHYRNQIIYDWFINPYRNELYVVVSDNSKCDKFLLTYDETGLYQSKVELGDKKHILNHIEMQFNFNGDPIITGTYNNQCNNLVIGLYNGRLATPDQLFYTELAHLPSFVEILPKGRRKRLVRRLEKGKSSNLRQRVLYTVPFHNEFGYQSIAEIYTQQSATPNISNTLQRSTRQFDTVPFEYKVNTLISVGFNYNGEIQNENAISVDGSAFNVLKPQSAYISKNDSLYSLIPIKKSIIYANMSKSTPDLDVFTLFKSDGLKIRDYDLELINFTPESALAYGVAYIQIDRGEQSFIRRSFFIKKFEVGIKEEGNQ